MVSMVGVEGVDRQGQAGRRLRDSSHELGRSAVPLSLNIPICTAGISPSVFSGLLCAYPGPENAGCLRGQPGGRGGRCHQGRAFLKAGTACTQAPGAGQVHRGADASGRQRE